MTLIALYILYANIVATILLEQMFLIRRRKNFPKFHFKLIKQDIFVIILEHFYWSIRHENDKKGVKVSFQY